VIGTFDNRAVGTALLVFDITYRFEDFLLGERRLGDGAYLTEFVVVERRALRLHRLLQQTSMTFCEGVGEPEDYLSYDSRSQWPTQDVMPEWKAEEAVWPTSDGRPMLFLWQVADVVLTENIYLFWAKTGTSSCYKIVTQMTGLQTAEEHYAREERSDRKRKEPRNRGGLR
jgi:hypothetical protein